MNKKNGILALAALGAYAYYKFTKMSPEQKEDLKGSLRDTGRKIVDNLPPEFRNFANEQIDKVSNKTAKATPVDTYVDVN